MANTLAVAFTIDQPAAPVEISTNSGTNWAPLTVPAAGTHKTGNLLNVPAGFYDIGVIQLRGVGYPTSVVKNLASVTIVGAGTAAPAPTITAVSPTSRAVGAAVTITGAAFGASAGTTSTVKFNGLLAYPTAWSDTSITVPVPTGATSGTITVTTAGGTATGAVFSVTTATGPPQVVMTGNSIIFNVGVPPTPLVQKLPNGWAVTNKGQSGSSIGGMQARYDTDITALYDPNASRHFLVAFEGVNTGRLGPAAQSTYVSDVKTYTAQAKAAGWEVIWLSALPNTIRPGQNYDTNPFLQGSNATLEADFPGLGIRFASNSNTVLGKFGTAGYGADAGFSSYGPINAAGTAIDPNRYFLDGTHPNSLGSDVLSRIMADHLLNIFNNTALPDRSTYGLPVATAYVPQSYIHLLGGATQSGNTATGGNSGSFGSQAVTAQSATAAGDRFKFQRGGGEIFIGLNTSFTVPGYSDMPYSLYFTNSGGVSVWKNGAYVRDITTVASTVSLEVFELELYAIPAGGAGIKCYKDGTLVDTDTTPLTLPIALDASLGSVSCSVTAWLLSAAPAVTA